MNLRALPLFVYILLVTNVLMFVPAIYAAAVGQFREAQVFGLSATVLLTISITISLAVVNRKPRSTGRLHLITLLMAYLFVPLICCLPFSNLVPSISLSQAYFEMLSSFTTTGASMFRDPQELSAPLHLWRSLVAWFGGLVVLVSAVSIMEPLSLGGFEIKSMPHLGDRGLHQKGETTEASDRVIRAVRMILPTYAVATALLALCLALLGETGFVAICHAMAILSTSGISPVGGLEQSAAGFLGELVILIFFILALSHRFLNGTPIWRLKEHLALSELKVAAVTIAAFSSLLFLFHFIGFADSDNDFTPVRIAQAFWGGFFTAASFLTTTGFVSDQWALAKLWADLGDAGLILLSLTALGGGVATTAGGIKLLRIYVLYKHGERELARLVHPSSVAGSGSDARHIRREGAFVTWMFVMLFVLSIAGISLALALCGLDFETAFVLSIASLSNTGPLATAFGPGITHYGDLSDNARMYLDISMIIGRMEILAVIALLNPTQWRL